MEGTNFEVVQVGPDEFHLLTSDGKGHVVLTRAELELLERMRENPLPLD